MTLRIPLAKLLDPDLRQSRTHNDDMSTPRLPQFHDLFSGHAPTYAKFRPTYPAELFKVLADLAPKRKLAWDCATGNGQAAVGLAQHFERVIATDASEEQIRHAIPCENVDYRVASAESPGLDDHSIDLVTVAQAIHWFDLDKFYAQVSRVLSSDGIIAAWCYDLPQVSPEIDRLIRYLHDNVVGPFWSEGNKLILSKYTTLPFPFDEVSIPEFYAESMATRDQLFGYLESWSASQRYAKQNGRSALEEIFEEFEKLWDASESKLVRHPLYFRVGRLPSNSR